MGPKTFQKIVDHMFPIREEFLDIPVLGGEFCHRVARDFDYPLYGDLPKRISNKLSPEAVDAMQDILQIKFVRKRDFARAYRDRLQELGEHGKYGRGIK